MSTNECQEGSWKEEKEHGITNTENKKAKEGDDDLMGRLQMKLEKTKQELGPVHMFLPIMLVSVGKTIANLALSV